MVIGILAVQGAFIEHEKKFESLGAKCIELRKKSDLFENHLDGIVLPGGESTVQGKLLHKLDMFEPLKQMILDGMPVFATCAGMILLSQHIANDETVHFGTLPVTVQRNAYGRQLGSFLTESEFEGVGKVPMTFIRAPFVQKVENQEVNVLAQVDGKIVAVQYKNQLALAFHPELNDNIRLHRKFLEMAS